MNMNIFADCSLGVLNNMLHSPENFWGKNHHNVFGGESTDLKTRETQIHPQSSVGELQPVIVSEFSQSHRDACWENGG